MFHSGNAFPIEEMKDILNLTHFECTCDPHGNNFTIFVTREQKRVNQLLHVFEEFNRDYPLKAIQIEGGLGLDPPIVTFGIHDNYKQHHIYLKIQSAKVAKQAGQDVPYKIWTPAIQGRLDREEARIRYYVDNSVQKEVMEDDPSAFRLGDENGCNPFGDTDDQYASDPDSSAQPLSVLDAASVDDALGDENSRDSIASLSSSSSSSLSPRAMKYSKVVKKVIGPILESLLKESKARDYLAASNERKDRDIEDHKHKRKSQEGKTAAQTRKANLAIQGEIRALKESAIARTEAEREKTLREKAEADQRTLLIANAGLSTALVNLSTGDKVC
jgi:hypothetical protein